MMTIEEMRQHEWVVSWSGGKDSTATIVLMHENKIPIKKIVYARMMYDDELPATLPIMTEFVDRAAEVFREWGYEVELVKSIKTARACAERKYHRSKYEFQNGHPVGITAFTRGHCEFTSIKIMTVEGIKQVDYPSMIGYAADETDRLHRLGEGKESIMVTLGIKESEAFNICRKYDLLSPHYDFGIKRDGCWFCPNAGKKERALIKREYPELYQKIVEMIEMCDYDTSRFVRNNWSQWLSDYVKDRNQLSFDFKEAKE